MSWGLFDYNTWMNEEIDVNNALFFFEGEENFETITLDACLPSSGCYIIAAYDSYGDGWNGGSLTVNINNSKELLKNMRCITQLGSTGLFCK